MTRILLVGDIHMSDHAPANATESYGDDIIAMLSHVAQMERDLDADAVVWAGDVFHHKAPSKTSHATVLKMINVVREYRNLLIVVGNHDVSNDVYESVSEKQPLGILFQSGAQELNGWHPTLPLFGVPWQQHWERDLQDAFEDWREDRKAMENPRPALSVTHASIFPPGQDPIYDHLDTTLVAQAMGNQGTLYYGHIHENHGIYEHEGVTFANVGALSRGSLTEYNTSRPIQVALWDDHKEEGGLYNPEPTATIEAITIPHKPASEVFRVQQVMDKKATTLSLDQFLSEVGSKTLDISSTASVVTHIRAMDVPDRIKARAISLVEEFSK